jgi:hypothetical protein
VPVTGATKIYLNLKSHKSRKVNFKLKKLPVTLPAGTYYLVAELLTPSGATSVAATTETIQVTAA